MFATMDGVNSWALAATETERRAMLDVAGTAADAAMVRGLGSIGVMTLGSHHQAHHLAIATGQDPHYWHQRLSRELVPRLT